MHYGNSSRVTLNQLVAIGSSDEIDFGELSVTEISNEIPGNVSNYGNTKINVSVRGYGGITDPMNPGNRSMWCETNNISVGAVKWSVTDTSIYASMANLTNHSNNMNLTLPIRTNDLNPGNDTNTTYWRIQIPLSAAGYCNGTLMFFATQV